VDRARLPAAALYPSRVFFSVIEINRGYNSHARRRQPRETVPSDITPRLVTANLRYSRQGYARTREKKEGGKKKGRGRRLLITSAPKRTSSRYPRDTRGCRAPFLLYDIRNLRPRCWALVVERSGFLVSKPPLFPFLFLPSRGVRDVV